MYEFFLSHIKQIKLSLIETKGLSNESRDKRFLRAERESGTHDSVWITIPSAIAEPCTIIKILSHFNIKDYSYLNAFNTSERTKVRATSVSILGILLLELRKYRRLWVYSLSRQFGHFVSGWLLSSSIEFKGGCI